MESEGKEWRETYQRMNFKFRKLEEDLRRAEEENEELRRRGKGKEGKRVMATDYDYGREVVSKKDIRRKYNFDS